MRESLKGAAGNAVQFDDHEGDALLDGDLAHRDVQRHSLLKTTKIPSSHYYRYPRPSHSEIIPMPINDALLRG